MDMYAGTDKGAKLLCFVVDHHPQVLLVSFWNDFVPCASLIILRQEDYHHSHSRRKFARGNETNLNISIAVKAH